ncbi:DUF6318 family protein [Arthrobacter sp. zg-Y1219]|uniref:DUF6318 family protein n=1 Tax=Arthrobacter sp. zg-Y1219 TaxID=3049067 RepID=UPI0024C36D8E|nr:DUF6318 family protein [Arthrobacter sp. zg-Y1219]MDK1361175.1 DUF6318 family protein [Arthrobacter sp. zg-Y1219]
MFRTGFRSDDFSAARLGALGLAAVLVLGGCSGSGDDPGAEAAEGSNSAAPSGSAVATESASASPTSTPTPTAAAYKPASAEGPAENVPLPVMPEVAREKSKEGLEAFARYWFDLINYGSETGEISLAQGLSGPECEICESFYGAMEEGYVGEDWVEGGKLTIVALGTSFVETPQGRFQVILSVKQEASVNRGPNGKVFGENPADKYSFAQIMEASYVGDHWVVDLVENM